MRRLPLQSSLLVWVLGIYTGIMVQGFRVWRSGFHEVKLLAAFLARMRGELPEWC